MKKRFTPPILVLLVVLILFSVVSCKDKPVEAPHEHAWDEGNVTTPPTCTEEGVRTYKCTGCSETKTEVVPPAGHKSDGGTVTEEPGYGKKGTKVYKCTVCGEVIKTEAVAALDAKETTIKFVEGHELSKTYDGKAVEVDKSWFVRDIGDGSTEAIPADDITIEFRKSVHGTFEVATEAVNAASYKLIVKTAATDEWKEGSAEFDFRIEKLNLGDISLSKVYDGNGTLEKTNWEGTAVPDSEKASLKYILYLKNADAGSRDSETVGSEFDGDAFMLGDTETYNYSFSSLTVNITKKKVDSLFLKMDYEVVAKDSEGYVKKVFNDIDGYPGLTVTIYPYNNKIDGEFVSQKGYDSFTYYIYTSEDNTEVKKAIDERKIASEAFLAYADLGENYEFPAAITGGIKLGQLTISAKALTGTVTASKQYDKDNTIRVTDLSGLEGICDADKKKLELVITMDSDKPGAALSSYELHYHPNGNTTCTSETGDECPTIRYKLSGDLQVNATIEKKALELPSAIYSVVLYIKSLKGGIFPVTNRKFYVESNGDTIALTYTDNADASTWQSTGVKTMSAENITIPEEYRSYYVMSGSSNLVLRKNDTATALTLGAVNTVEESSFYKVYSISLTKDTRYKIVLTNSSPKEEIGVVSSTGVHPSISKIKGGRAYYAFTAPANGIHYITVNYSDNASHKYSVTVSEVTSE